MFGKASMPQNKINSLIGAGTHIEGNLLFNGGLRIDGKVKGDVCASGDDNAMLVVSEHAQIDGEIRVPHVVINGTVNGPIRADQYLELQSKAKINGDVHYKTLEMQLGAIVQGQLCITSQQESASVVELKRSSN